MSIYRETRILGRVGDELSPDLFVKLGRALAEELHNAGAVAVGRDEGDISQELKAALVRGLTAGGVVVADVGSAARSVVDFTRRLLRADASAVVSGGDAPTDCSGLILCFGHAPADAERTRGLQSLVEGPALPDVDRGEVESWEEDIVEEYLAWLRKAIAPSKGNREFKVVFEAGAGPLKGLAERALADRAGITAGCLGAEQTRWPAEDGLDDAALKDLGRRVRETGADVGVALGPDGMAVRFVDERGKPVPVDPVALIVLKAMGDELKGKTVVLDARCGHGLINAVKELGAQVVLERGGLGRIVARTASEGAAFGFDSQGLYAFRELAGEADNVYMTVRLVEALRDGSDTLSKLAATLPRGEIIGDVRVACPAQSMYTILNRLRAKYPGNAQAEVAGGLRLRLELGWAVCLPCEADETVTFRFQGQDRERVEEIAGEILNMAPEFRAEARRQAGLPELAPPEETYEDWFEKE